MPDRPADFHHALDSDLHDLHERRGSQLAYLAPRGGAKSTVVTLGYVVRCAVEGWEPYIVILSDVGDQSKLFLNDVREELEGNALLAAVYPDACGPTGEWRANLLRLRNGVRVEALSRGGRIRGRRNRQHRPTLIVMDDVQSNRDILSEDERNRAWEWFTREVLPARDPRANVLSLGTALHRQAVAVRVGQLPGWVGKTFQAIHSWPERMDLWDEWCRLATNLLDPDRAGAAAAFLAANRVPMSRGAVTYWPDRFPVAALMAERAKIGPSAFDTEYQQNAAAGGKTEWPADYFEPSAVNPFWFDRWPDDLPVRVAWYDGAGERTAKPGDYHALVLLGLTRDGHLWFDADLWHGGGDTDACGRLDRRCREFRAQHVGVEENFARGLFLTAYGLWLRLQNVGRADRDSLPGLPVRGVINTEPKDTRIRTADPYFAQRKVHVRNTAGGRMLVDQWRDFPFATYKDGPDAAAGTIRLATYGLTGR
jgi:hypothetical protein